MTSQPPIVDVRAIRQGNLPLVFRDPRPLGVPEKVKRERFAGCLAAAGLGDDAHGSFVKAPWRRYWPEARANAWLSAVFNFISEEPELSQGPGVEMDPKVDHGRVIASHTSLAFAELGRGRIGLQRHPEAPGLIAAQAQAALTLGAEDLRLPPPRRRRQRRWLGVESWSDGGTEIPMMMGN